MVRVASDGRPTQLVNVKGRSIVIRKLMDAQLMHLARHSKILQSESVGIKEKLNSVDRMFSILETVIVQPSDREYVIRLQEEGELELKDLLDWVKVFTEEEQEKETKPQVRRGRAPIKRS